MSIYFIQRGTRWDVSLVTLLPEKEDEMSRWKQRAGVLEAMLRCSEEWCEFWEREAQRNRGGETYSIPLPVGWSRRRTR